MNRTQATAEYKKAVATRRAMEELTAEQFNEAAYQAACEAEKQARAELVAAEIAAPTKQETKRAAHTLYLRNRGLDA